MKGELETHSGNPASTITEYKWLLNNRTLESEANALKQILLDYPTFDIDYYFSSIPYRIMILERLDGKD